MTISTFALKLRAAVSEQVKIATALLFSDVGLSPGIVSLSSRGNSCCDLSVMYPEIAAYSTITVTAHRVRVSSYQLQSIHKPLVKTL
ncbi:hypothetical protein [Desulfogranum marinum]|uniref:hypothetical protein n=1 Tax=Desulfogranum marinum TaxID=453220 RepID=UPI001962D473|nr:hypothetical protein [Desulfogranum marinum]MBM9515149.1 hypothetical protein [Desulfogranum marinum]